MRRRLTVVTLLMCVLLGLGYVAAANDGVNLMEWVEDSSGLSRSIHIDFEDEAWLNYLTINSSDGAYIGEIDGVIAVQRDFPTLENEWNRINIKFGEPITISDFTLLRLRYRVESEEFRRAGYTTNDWITVRIYYTPSQYASWRLNTEEKSALDVWHEAEVFITDFEEISGGDKIYEIRVYERGFGGLAHHLAVDYIEFVDYLL